MTCQMWIAIAMCVAGHLLLHFKESRLYRFAGAWIITGAFGLASGIAIPCWIECNVWRLEFSKAQAAEPAEKMAAIAQLNAAVIVENDAYNAYQTALAAYNNCMMNNTSPPTSPGP